MDTRSIGRPPAWADGAPPATPDASGGGRRSRVLAILAGAVIGLVMVVLAAVAVVRLFGETVGSPSEAASVRDVAALSVDVAESVDVDGGVALLCENPMDLYRMTVEATLVRWQTDGRGIMPVITATTSDIDDGPTGSFVIRISRELDAGGQQSQDFRVFVDDREGRSCITGVGNPGSERQTTRFSGDGYSRATPPSLAPAPR